MRKHLHVCTVAALAALLLPLQSAAKQGAPHTYGATPVYSSVQLQWQAPNAAKELRHHTNYDYDGDAGIASGLQKPAVIYIAADFNASELPAGEVITSLNYFEYRPVVSLTALIYENGTLVRQQSADLQGFTANQWRSVQFDSPYTIPEGKDIRIGFRIEHGTNIDFVAIMDNVSNPRGDLRSYDGVHWQHNGRGAYLITANLANDVDEAPQGYNVYVDNTKANTDLIADTDYTLNNQTDGEHTYRVEAVYPSATYSVQKTLSVLGSGSYFPGVSTLQATVDGVTTQLTRRTPLLRGADNLLTWHAATDTYANSIGGTASSNTKVWIQNSFTSADILSFAGAKIKAVRAQLHEAEAQQIIVWVMKDNVIVQHDTVPQSIIESIVPDQWVSFPLSQPVSIEPGHSYAYGYYMIHTPKKHPVSVNNGTPYGSKSNSFSTSSANSTNFANSKPIWKTLASGNIPGNWILAAELDEGAPYAESVASYNIYRDGTLVKQGVTATEYAEEATQPGTYVYAVEAMSNSGKPSEHLTVKAVINVPDSYRTPLIGKSTFNKESRQVEFDWGMDIELKHHGPAAYKAGFAEEMALNWGTRFTAAELAQYAGYTITKLNFILGQEIPGGFKLQIHNGAGQELSSTSIAAGDVSALTHYSLTLEEPITITGTDDLIFSYSATLPGNCSAIVLDEGPLQEGGAVVRLVGTSNWMNLGTINSTYNKYNVVISAVAAEPSASGASRHCVALGANGTATDLARVELSSADIQAGFGIAPTLSTPIKTTSTKKSSEAESFNVYRNGQLIGNTTQRKFTDLLPAFDNYAYQVSAIYNNVWESALSDALIIANGIEQALPAPYDLQINEDFTLSWQAPQQAPVLTYCTADATSYGVGMTGSGERTSYITQKFPVDSIAAHAGSRVNRIRFGLYTTEVNYASVIVIKDFNIIYEQEVPVANLLAIQDGWNDILLNEPVTLEADHEYMFGYMLKYANGVKPMLFDAGPAVNNYGNLLSASASHTSWKSLKSMSASLDGNWRIYTTLMAPDNLQLSAPRRADSELTYNLYQNGAKVREGITATDCMPAWVSGQNNLFTVTATQNGVESAHSNQVSRIFKQADEVTVSTAIYYDAATATLVTDTAGILYDAAGRRLARIATDTNIARLAAGTYIFRCNDGRTVKFVK